MAKVMCAEWRGAKLPVYRVAMWVLVLPSSCVLKAVLVKSWGWVGGQVGGSFESSNSTRKNKINLILKLGLV